MKLLFFILILSFQFISFSQSTFGLGGGISLNKTESDNEEDTHSEYEIIDELPKYSFHLYYEYKFSDKYSQDVRVTYNEVSYRENLEVGDFMGWRDTSDVSIKSLNFINLHKFRLFKNVPIYAEFGLNIIRPIKVYKSTVRHDFNYGQPNVINDSTNNINTYYSIQDYNPHTWNFGFSLGLMYKIRLSDHMNLRIESLYFQQFNGYKVEETSTKSLQFNLGLAYSLSKLKKDTVNYTSNGKNLINLGYSFTSFKNTSPGFSFHLSLQRSFQNKKYYLGLGIIRDQKNIGSPSETYSFHLAAAYRPIKFISICFNPGIQIYNLYGHEVLPSFDFGLNFPFAIKELELGPFLELGIRKYESNFYGGIKLGLNL